MRGGGWRVRRGRFVAELAASRGKERKRCERPSQINAADSRRNERPASKPRKKKIVPYVYVIWRVSSLSGPRGTFPKGNAEPSPFPPDGSARPLPVHRTPVAATRDSLFTIGSATRSLQRADSRQCAGCGKRECIPGLPDLPPPPPLWRHSGHWNSLIGTVASGFRIR